MNKKRILCLWITVIFTVMCLCVPGIAAVQNDEIVSDRVRIQSIVRTSGRINGNIPANTIVEVGDSFFMLPEETITYDCTYTPSNVSLDFGFIAPDGYFYSINCTSGSINKTIRVSQRGSYTLAIRNNSDSTVTVTGMVNY